MTSISASDTQPRPGRRRNMGDGERVATTLGGGALAIYALTRSSWGGRALSLAGGALILRGLSGRCPIYRAAGISTAAKPAGTLDTLVGGRGAEVRCSVTIDCPVEDLFALWKDLSNLPRFMKHLESVENLSHGRSRWRAKAPFNKTVSWTAEIIEESENELIAWRAVEGSQIPNAGLVRFRPAPAGRGTELHLHLSYRAPLGTVGRAAAKLLGEEPAKQVEEDLRRLKRIMETGEIPTIEGQTHGTRAIPPGSERPDLEKRFGYHERDPVEEASWESFPASDPPAW